MLAFHGDKAIKSKYLRRVVAHRRADELIRGVGWEDGRGCAVGCTLNQYSHSQYQIELGIPEVIAHLEDNLFESLPEKLAMTWPSRFLRAIPVGADLSMVWCRFSLWLLTDGLPKRSRHIAADMAALFRRRIASDDPTPAEWDRAAEAATAAWAAEAARAVRAAWAAERQSKKLLELLRAAPVEKAEGK